MAAQLFDLTVRFLEPAFHGRTEGGRPEWPPSPLRVMQALVAAAAALGPERGLAPQSAEALRWLERLAPPTLLAPPGWPSLGYRLSVPNNALDLVAQAWSRGNDTGTGDANPATHRAMKTVRPTHLLDDGAVHYLWSLPEPLSRPALDHVETLTRLAHHLVAVGWGVDLAAGHAALLSQEQSEELPGERWLPTEEASGEGLRVPVADTLDALLRRHDGFLARLQDGHFTPPPPLTRYRKVAYRRALDPPRRPAAAFSVLKPDASGFQAFNTVRQALTLAGMMRHVTRRAAVAAGWDKGKVDAFVLGHSPCGEGADEHRAVGAHRLAYLPLPSIEYRGVGQASHVGSIRRVLLTTFGDSGEAEIVWARRALSGQELIEAVSQQPAGLLSLIPDNEKVVARYTAAASCWATVTPVVLPGYDDPAHCRRRLAQGTEAEEQKQLLGRLDRRIESLLRKAIVQAGLSQTLADHAELQWRKVGFWPGGEHADRYGVPDHLQRFPRWHLQVRWRDEQGRPVLVPGPLCLGGGRYYGLGLCAAVQQQA